MAHVTLSSAQRLHLTESGITGGEVGYFLSEELGTQVRKTELKADHMADCLTSKQKSRDAGELSGSERWSGSVACIDILEVIMTGPCSRVSIRCTSSSPSSFLRHWSQNVNWPCRLACLDASAIAAPLSRIQCR